MWVCCVCFLIGGFVGGGNGGGFFFLLVMAWVVDLWWLWYGW